MTFTPEQSQQEFEYWMQANNPDMKLARWRAEDNQPFDYINAFTEAMWEGWVAGVLASQIQSPEVGGPPEGVR